MLHKILTAVTALAVVASMLAGAGQAAAVSGYNSAYFGESAFLTLAPGTSGQFAVGFNNTGSTGWVVGSSSQVDLTVCQADQLTCNTTSPNAAFASGWLSSTQYATASTTYVGPGQTGFFVYNVAVPAAQAGGTYRFNGDLALHGTASMIHQQGYYQDVQVNAAPVVTGPAVSPDFGSANNKDNTINQEHAVTFSGLPAGTVALTVLASSNVTKAADGTYSFRDENSDKRADGLCTGTTYIINVDGVTQPAASPCVFGVTVPSDGTLVVRINTATPNQRVRVVAWQDKNSNGQIDLSTAGSADGAVFGTYDATTDGVLVASGVKYYFNSEGTFGTQFGGTCQPIYRHDKTNQIFSAGATSASSAAYKYDSNDTFRIIGTPVSMATFQSALVASSTGAGSTVSINYNTSPAGVSEFNLCNNAGAAAPTSLTAVAGNYDGGTVADDVRLSFTAPSTNTISSYGIQRQTAATCVAADAAPANYVTIGSVSVAAGDPGTFTDFDRANGTYAYRVRTVNPNTGVEAFSPCALATVPGVADILQPTSTNAVLTQSAGLANTMDTGDKFSITFSEAMSISSTALIRFTDSDCGQTTDGTAGPVACTGGTTQTVGDVICGTNATCTYNSTTFRLDVTLTGNPTIIAAGSTAGVQYRATVTDSSGITDSAGNPWNIVGSADRNIGPALGQ